MKKKMSRIFQAIYFRISNFIDKKLPLYIYKSKFLSILYYFLFNSSFKRELNAVINGKVKHLLDSKIDEGNYFLLVRNIHRIEKGLLMRPRREIFAKKYISETVNNFELIWDRSRMEENRQLKWFYDVLLEYFNTCGDDKLLNRLKIKFNTIIGNDSENSFDQECKSIPYFRQASDFNSVTFDDFYRLTRQRRSVRWFSPKEVPRDVIDKAILAAIQSPSACNRQPFEFRVFDEPELVKQVVDLPMGTTGYGHSIPVMVVLVGNLDAYYNERDRHVIYIDASLAAMTFMYALETLGLSSCPINWPDIESRESKMEKFLNLKPYQRPVMCIGLGYPDSQGMVAFSEKRNINIVRKFN